MRPLHLAVLVGVVLVLLASMPPPGPGPLTDPRASPEADVSRADAPTEVAPSIETEPMELGAPDIASSLGATEEATPLETAFADVPSGARSCRSFAPVDRVSGALHLVNVLTGLERPTQVLPARDGTGRLYLVEQGGKVRMLCAGLVAPEPFLDIAHLVSRDEEAGLLSIALWPPQGETTEVFAFYNDEHDDIVIARYPVAPTYDRALVEQGATVLRIPSGPGTHYGGTLAFGPDGLLYISVGDTDAQDNPSNTAQDLSALQGKILRIDVTQTPYAIPPSNPFVDGPGRPEIVAYGLRNPWRMSFDEETGDLWIGDVGNSRAEEIDVLRAGELGANFGWRVWEGNERRHEDETAPNATAPYFTYAPTRGYCANTGGVLYRGDTYPALQGKFVYTDFCHAELLALESTDEGVRSVGVTPAPRLLVGVYVDDVGVLYALSRDGTLLRLEALGGGSPA